MMYTISQFSKICRITPKALRYYEEIGLLKPALVNPDNQYRYYTQEQIESLQTITLMKTLGMPLKTIRELLNLLEKGESPAALLGEHRKRLLTQMEQIKDWLPKLSWWQQQRENNTMSGKRRYDIIIRDLPEITVHSRREQMMTVPQEVFTLGWHLQQELQDRGIVNTSPVNVLYYDKDFDPEKADVEVAFPVTDQRAITGKLPSVRAATCVHVGPYDGLCEAFAFLCEWVNRNGYTIIYPIRMIYLKDATMTPPEQLETEIVIPIEMLTCKESIDQ